MLPVRTLARQPTRRYRPDMAHPQHLTLLSVTVDGQQ